MDRIPEEVIGVWVAHRYGQGQEIGVIGWIDTITIIKGSELSTVIRLLTGSERIFGTFTNQYEGLYHYALIPKEAATITLDAVNMIQNDLCRIAAQHNLKVTDSR